MQEQLYDTVSFDHGVGLVLVKHSFEWEYLFPFRFEEIPFEAV